MPFVDYELPREIGPCISPEHNPPNMIVLPPGKHVWKCPVCGQETVVFTPIITC